ncbi:hypothetical protein SK128_027461 [Halocaridina rubra]|uniref:Uncharacterized protein n=1 Tax=Halocaridina rubra TaxID=373956 RepID=A0AAN9ADK9_HALRR
MLYAKHSVFHRDGRTYTVPVIIGDATLSTGVAKCRPAFYYWLEIAISSRNNSFFILVPGSNPFLAVDSGVFYTAELLNATKRSWRVVFSRSNGITTDRLSSMFSPPSGKRARIAT